MHLDFDATGDDDDPQLIKLIHALSRSARILWPETGPDALPRSFKGWMKAPVANDALPVRFLFYLFLFSKLNSPSLIQPVSFLLEDLPFHRSAPTLSFPSSRLSTPDYLSDPDVPVSTPSDYYFCVRPHIDNARPFFDLKKYGHVTELSDPQERSAAKAVFKPLGEAMVCIYLSLPLVLVLTTKIPTFCRVVTPGLIPTATQPIPYFVV